MPTPPTFETNHLDLTVEGIHQLIFKPFSSTLTKKNVISPFYLASFRQELILLLQESKWYIFVDFCYCSIGPFEGMCMF